jgi:hypothetical protein
MVGSAVGRVPQCANGCARTDNSMRFHRDRRCVLLAPILQQRPDIALVIDLDGLLRCRRVVAGRGRLKDEAIDGGEDEQLPNKRWHLIGGTLRVQGLLARRRPTSGRLQAH